MNLSSKVASSKRNGSRGPSLFRASLCGGACSAVLRCWTAAGPGRSARFALLTLGVVLLGTVLRDHFPDKRARRTVRRLLLSLRAAWSDLPLRCVAGLRAASSWAGCGHAQGVRLPARAPAARHNTGHGVADCRGAAKGLGFSTRGAAKGCAHLSGGRAAAARRLRRPDGPRLDGLTRAARLRQPPAVASGARASRAGSPSLPCLFSSCGVWPPRDACAACARSCLRPAVASGRRSSWLRGSFVPSREPLLRVLQRDGGVSIALAPALVVRPCARHSRGVLVPLFASVRSGFGPS
jgi:hypothetical protein